MAGIFERSSSLDSNPNNQVYPVVSDINLTAHGTYWLWAVMAIMAFSTIAFTVWGTRVPKERQVFHHITAAITLVATIAYFTMASNLGYAAVPVEFQRSDPKVAGMSREIFYVRYIDWVITTPLLLLDLLLLSGMPMPTILFTVLADEVMIITGLVGALVASQYKWGYYVFGNLALFYVCWNVIFVARKDALRLDPKIQKIFTICGAWTMFLWFIYPIAWGLAEGGNVIAPDSEAAFYGVLDVLAKPGFGLILLWGHGQIPAGKLRYAYLRPEGHLRSGLGNDAEKNHHHNGNGIQGDSTTVNHPQASNGFSYQNGAGAGNVDNQTNIHQPAQENISATGQGQHHNI